MELVLVVFGIVLAVVLGLGGLLLAVFGLLVAKARTAALNPPPHPARLSPPVPGSSRLGDARPSGNGD
jgi:hypothetical protein